ncbi:MAG: hypothetical protein ACKOHI_01835, partial [Phycisphaerales bacterium]
MPAPVSRRDFLGWMSLAAGATAAVPACSAGRAAPTTQGKRSMHDFSPAEPRWDLPYPSQRM